MNETLAAGQRLGRYELVCPAGHGGMATVWLARLVGTRGFNKPVAVKTLHPSIREDAEAERMFLAEAALASRIRHPNVVEVLDLGEEGGNLYLVMEWIHGESLSTVLTRASKRGGVPLSVAIRIGAQVCAGLHAAHELTDEEGKPLGLVHRDVSPQNVLLGFNGMVKLVDFGIAKATAEATHLTEMGVVRGKVAYMAPEQIRVEKLDRRTDVFAAGILLYNLTTGRHPFKRDERNETVRAICSDEPAPPPTSFIPGFPERLERVLLRALAKNPDDRYATAQELADELLRTLPPSRSTPQEELQRFAADLMPDRLAYHQDLIRQAVGVKGVTSMSGGTAPKSAHSSSTLRAVSVTEPAPTDGPEVVDGEGRELEPSTPVPTLRPKAKASTMLVALAAGAVVGAVALSALTRSHGDAGVAASGARPPAPSAAELAKAAPANADERMNPRLTTPDAGPSEPAPPATAKHEAARTVPHGAARHPVAKSPAASPAPATGLKDPYGQ